MQVFQSFYPSIQKAIGKVASFFRFLHQFVLRRSHEGCQNFKRADCSSRRFVVDHAWFQAGFLHAGSKRHAGRFDRHGCAHLIEGYCIKTNDRSFSNHDFYKERALPRPLKREWLNSVVCMSIVYFSRIEMSKKRCFGVPLNFFVLRNNVLCHYHQKIALQFFENVV